MGLFDWLFRRDKKSAKPNNGARQTTSMPQRQSSPAPASKRPTSSVAPAAPRGATASDAQWIGPGKRVKIQGFDIPGGMLYIGRHLEASGRRSEPSLINPDLKVDHTRSRSTDQDPGYWPAYGELTPENRATYLSWLASGRRDPAVSIGYVFIFMYGLERRVLIDIFEMAALEPELSAIRAEMAELLKLYGHTSGSFRGYATHFIDAIDVISARRMDRPLPPVELRTERWTVPPTLLIELGSRAAHNVPIPPELALAWAWYHPEVSPRTPATRCREEFTRLFALRFNQKFPGGLMTKPGKSRVQISYRAASAGLGEMTLQLPETPDIFGQKLPGRKLIELFEQVTNELDPYSRWLARNADRAGSLAAAALLPPDLLSESPGAVDSLRRWAAGKLGEQSVVKTAAIELLRMVPSAASDKLTRPEGVLLAQLLGNLGFGIEPDVRFGGSPLTAESQIVLFHLSLDAPTVASSAYSAATTLVQLAAAVGAADGDMSIAEIDHLGKHLESSLSLSPAEQQRLQAHVLWMSTAEIKLTGLKRRLDEMPQSRRESIGNLMISVATADGVVSPGEVTILGKIFRLLGLDANLVTSHLHATLTASKPRPASQPIVVRPGHDPEPGYQIPPRPAQPTKSQSSPAPTPFTLDAAAIQDKLAQTAEVSALLGDLFTEVDVVDAEHTSSLQPVKTDGDEAVQSVAGLSGTHALLLRAVAKRDEWSRNDFEALAAEHHLMPEGAIDMLNEAAYEVAGEPFIEGDEVLMVNTYAREEMLT